MDNPSTNFENLKIEEAKPSKNIKFINLKVRRYIFQALQIKMKKLIRQDVADFIDSLYYKFDFLFEILKIYI